MAQLINDQQLSAWLTPDHGPAEEQIINVPPAPPAGLDTALFEHDERLARRDLRLQISRLDAALGRLFGSAFPRLGIEWRVAGMGGPRILSADELEKVRDSLLVKLRDASAELGRRTEAEAGNRALIEDMTADPSAYKWVRVSNEDIGEPGCRHWHSRPRWGVLGMFLDWWRVKVSSGCPLANGRGYAAPAGKADGANGPEAQAQAATRQSRRGGYACAGRSHRKTFGNATGRPQRPGRSQRRCRQAAA